MNDKQFHNLMKTMIREELKAQGLLVGQWHLGKVGQIVSTKQLKCYIDGGDVLQTVACNPSVTFAVNDEIWVIYINGNARDKFAISKRAI
jgi:hypothetical protein